MRANRRRAARPDAMMTGAPLRLPLFCLRRRWRFWPFFGIETADHIRLCAERGSIYEQDMYRWSYASVCAGVCAGRESDHSAISGDAAELSAATCSMNGKNFPLNVMTTRFSPILPTVPPTVM